jgi:hypothetical protein
LQFQMPLGFRRELSTVRNAQIALTKEHAVLQEAELELSHTLATAWRSLEDDYQLSNTNFQRRSAAQRNVEAVGAAYDTGILGANQIDVLLQAQRTLAQAESDYYRSLVNYNKDIMLVHFRKGSLLEYNGVYLAEGPWPGKAYFDARRRARARDAAMYFDYGFTQPKVVSQGPFQQFFPKSSLFCGETEPALPDGGKSNPEPVPTPAPLEPGYNHRETKPATAVPPPPVPEDSTTAYPPAKAGKQAAQRSVSGTAKPAGRKTFDVSSLQLNNLEDNPIQQTSAAEPVGGQDSAAAIPQKSSRLQWTAPKQSSSYDSNANPSTGQSDRPASGWQGVQR